MKIRIISFSVESWDALLEILLNLITIKIYFDNLFLLHTTEIFFYKNIFLSISNPKYWHKFLILIWKWKLNILQSKNQHWCDARKQFFWILNFWLAFSAQHRLPTERKFKESIMLIFLEMMLNNEYFWEEVTS